MFLPFLGLPLSIFVTDELYLCTASKMKVRGEINVINFHFSIMNAKFYMGTEQCKLSDLILMVLGRKMFTFAWKSLYKESKAQLCESTKAKAEKDKYLMGLEIMTLF